MMVRKAAMSACLPVRHITKINSLFRTVTKCRLILLQLQKKRNY